MGRWEATKKIKPFRGAYYFGEKRHKNEEKERIREIQQAKKVEATENNCEKATLAKVQNMADDYGVPQTQAQVEVPSVAEEIDKTRPEQPEPIDTISDKDRLLAVLRKHGYQTEEEWRAELKRRSDIRRTKFTDDQLVKLADELDVEWYRVGEDVYFLEPEFEQAVDDFYGAIDDMVGKSFAEKKAIIKEWYLSALRDPYGFGDYESMQRMMVEYYGLKETKNKNGTPIGKYGKYLNYFDDVYDNWRKQGIYPDLYDVTYEMDKLIEDNKFDKKRAEKYRRQLKYEEWKRRQAQEPARIISYQYMSREGLPFMRS